MRTRFSSGYRVRAGKLLAIVVASVLLWACSGSDGNTSSNANVTPATPSQPVPDQPPPGVKANTVSAIVEEVAEVLAYVGNSTGITIDFSAAEGTASALKLEPPAAPGWQSADGKLGCDSVSAAQPCKLRLRYAPDAPAASASLKLSYAYVDSAGNARSDSLVVNYRALAANAATVTLDPAGTVNGVVGSGSTITVSFATNDGSAANALHADLAAALPAGWSANASVFDCATFGGGSACQLQLLYQPSASTALSSFDLPYAYVDSAGKVQSGKLTIAYAALAPNTVLASVFPASQVAVAPGASRELRFSFVPSDGKFASAVKLSADNKLPEGWSIKSSTLPCDTVGADGKCQLVLGFAPTTSLPLQQLELGFDYVNATGQAQHGVASVSYSSRIYRAYAAEFNDGQLGGGPLQCEVAADGALLNCAKVASAWPAVATNRVIVSGARAYVITNLPLKTGARALSVCDLNIDGGLINCTNAGASFDGISSFAVMGPNAYLISPIGPENGQFNRITRCTVDGRGTVPQEACAQLPIETTGLVLPTALTAFKSSLYVAALVGLTNSDARLLRCVDDPSVAAQTRCQTVAAEYPQTIQGMAGASLAGGDYLYLLSGDSANASGAIVKCTLAADGSISGCDGGKLPDGLASADLAQAGNIAIAGKLVYLAVSQGNLKGVLRCPIDEATGDISSCAGAGDTGANTPFDIAVR